MTKIDSIPCYAAVQNDIILDIFPTYEEAKKRVDEEIARDFISIVLKRKLRKLFRKNANVALHRYSVLKISESEVIK